MTIAPPRMLLDDLLYTHRSHLLASSAATSHAAALLGNRRMGSYWSPAAATFEAGAVTVDVFPVDGQLIPSNWYFRDWALGAALAPDSWTLAGTDGTIARSTTAPSVGSYAAAVTRVGTDVRLYQAVSDASSLRSRRVTAGALVVCGVADRAYIGVYDGSTRWLSSAHTGGGTKEWLTVTSGRIASAATSVVIELWVRTGNTVATFHGPLLALGDSAPQTPHATSVDAVALAGHTLGTDGTSLTVLSSNDNFSTSTTRALIQPTTDSPMFRHFGMGSASAWRLTFTGGAYSPAPQVQVAALGCSVAFPRAVVEGYDPRNVRAQTELTRASAGTPLGRLVRQKLRRLRLTQPVLTETDLDGLASLRQHAVLDAMPFFLAWDLGEHTSDADYVWCPDNATWTAPLERMADGLATRKWSMDLEAVAV